MAHQHSPNQNQSAQVVRKRGWLISAGTMVCAGAVLVWGQFFAEPSFEQVMREARAAFHQHDFAAARQLAGQALELKSDATDALMLKGQASFLSGFATEAEQIFQDVLHRDDGNLEARLNLVRLLKVQGRFREMRPHARTMLEAGDTGSEFLIPLAAPDDCRFSDEELALIMSFGQAVPDDVSPLLGAARTLRQNAETERADALLRRTVEVDPDNLDAQAMWGRMILDRNDDSEFLDWHHRLPSDADHHPEIWFLRGAWLRMNGQDRCAIRCLLEAVRRDPNHRRANLFLSQLFSLIGEGKTAQLFARRFELLEEAARLATRGDDSSRVGMSAETLHRIATLMEQLGRLREAAGWAQQALIREPDFSDAQRLLDDLNRRIDDHTPLTLVSENPVREVDVSEYPLPDWSSLESVRRLTSDRNSDTIRASFTDRAEALGLKFQFFNAADPAAGRARMFEFSGGGAAVLDYDGDFWPDLYLTQGCPWPPVPSEYQDVLSRNIEGTRFEDVTAQCRLKDSGYGQGAAVGDFNNDGFPDLYVSNIGRNRFYRNNGDGTFSEISQAVDGGGDEWTLSCLLADLNGDSLPDLYCVNYLAGNDVYDRVCQNQGLPIQCPLHLFPSEQDRFFLNQGNGHFADATETSGFDVPDGKGMGAIAADFSQTGQLSLFVANDNKPNFFFSSHQENRNGVISYLETGVLTGLAFGDFGTAQSSMGTAAGDVNNDGLLDLFVTNFAAEHNNLYVQKSVVVFEDQARQAGLHGTTLQPMGWGTQFIDGDLDGLLDIVVANGHLDRNTAGSIPHRMKAQYFQNLGNAHFTEASSSDIGSYFDRPRVGRAVVRLDWNRDGASDLGITHVESPVALLMNESADRGNFLSLRLRGIQSSRDAIGAIVKVTVGKQSLFRHLTAGDGFQASNERKLIFGLDSRQTVDEVRVYWPSGLEQTVFGLPVNTEALIIEGQAPRLLSRH